MFHIFTSIIKCLGKLKLLSLRIEDFSKRLASFLLSCFSKFKCHEKISSLNAEKTTSYSLVFKCYCHGSRFRKSILSALSQFKPKKHGWNYFLTSWYRQWRGKYSLRFQLLFEYFVPTAALYWIIPSFEHIGKLGVNVMNGFQPCICKLVNISLFILTCGPYCNQIESSHTFNSNQP